MVDRFNNGDRGNDNPIHDLEVHSLANYHGGDIVGITQKIKDGYFSNLGINTIWMSPIMQGPDSSFIEAVSPNRKYTGYHGYWPVDSRKVDPRFGTTDELKEMIETAHTFGITVLLDFVSNHTHEEHHYFSEHPEWFGDVELEDGTLNIRNWSEETMLTTWFDTFLPSFDYENNEDAIDQVVDDAIFWITEFGFDGFRQDATKHVPHTFWKKLRFRLDKEYSEESIFQIGETFGSDDLILSYVNPGELDSQFNFSNYFNLREYFSSSNSVQLHQLIKSINQNLVKFGPINLMGNITSSHDQVRLMALIDGQIRIDENGVERSFTDLPSDVNDVQSYDRHFMFTAMNMLLPGVPVIYYGEEYGQIGANDPGNRTDMRFYNNWSNEENRLYQKVRMLIHARKKYPSLALGDLLFIYDEDDQLICKKKYFNEKCIFIFNLSNEEKIINIIPESDGQWLSLLDRSVLNIENGQTQLLIGPNETKAYYIHE
jgi:glycosidase